jgi:hypothetical protein
MLYVQLLMLGLVVVVWILLYYIWKEVDFFILTELREEAPPQNLEDLIARSKGKR